MQFSSPFFISLRILAKKILPNSLLNIIRDYLFNGNYENNFDNKMIATLKKNNIVFDIGANIGFYSEKFAKIVGQDGHVYAFEPFIESAKKIKTLQKKYPWITLEQSAVGDKNGKILFQINRTYNSNCNTNEYFSSMIDIDQKDANSVEIPIFTLDNFSKKYDIPDLIKIDVEGYELNVLMGAREILACKKVKHIFIEIHFSLLEKRGLPFGPKKITNLLIENGFKVNYLDPSHIHAYRIK